MELRVVSCFVPLLQITRDEPIHKRRKIFTSNEKSGSQKCFGTLGDALALSQRRHTVARQSPSSRASPGWHASPIPEEELERDKGYVWYLPHFGVYHPKKPSKVRVVFDASAEFEGMSLNKVLLSGPDLTNSLLGVLMHFS